VLDDLELDRWLYGTGHVQRHTQDSPILPDVWYAYALPRGKRPGDPPEDPELIAPEQGLPGTHAPRLRPSRSADLLLRPDARWTPGQLAAELGRRLKRPREDTRLAFNDAYVVCRLTFYELLCKALPLTEYWRTDFWPGERGSLGSLVERSRQKFLDALSPEARRFQGRRIARDVELPGDAIWLVALVGRIAWEREAGFARTTPPTAAEIIDAALPLLHETRIGMTDEEEAAAPPMWATASRNRPVTTAVWRSRMACKADAAITLFDLSCRDVHWAVIDSGVDARHPAFARRDPGATATPVETSGTDAAQSGRSRIRATWDFAPIRDVLAGMSAGEQDPRTAEELRKGKGKADGPPPPLEIPDPEEQEDQRLARWVRSGRAVDWSEIAPKLKVEHDEAYRPPKDEHGTHVAGIIAADWRVDDDPHPDQHVQGMCPDMEIYDLRAFDDAGQSDEFQVLSAMQFVRHLNAHSEQPLVHGVNLSFSLFHEVDKYAAGATPVCEEAHRLVGSGVVVVAAAGNEGRCGYSVRGRSVEGYRSVSITDPGNAEKVITVGATHRDRPHTYGVSYFSSRGPTGDGRAKPDLVAPGEKITSPLPGGEIGSKDGTSQAAPHVSGACALLMARHPELMGKPDRIKQILVESCTDLGRERAFQGAGVIDVLRAIQAV
jgi:subtilisin family serine protease